MKFVKNIKNLKDKKVLLRLDLNEPIKNQGEILDDFRLKKSLETINYLISRKAKIIIISHLGEPQKTKKVRVNKKKYSLKKIALRLEKLLSQKVEFVDDCIGRKVERKIAKMKKCEIIMLENLRFHNEENKNDRNFAKKLAKLADIYVNDAFGTSHRNQASVSAIKNYLPSYTGFLIKNELLHLNKVLKKTKGLIILFGGAKIKTKLPLIKKFIKKADYILIGGVLINYFLKSLNLSSGKYKVNKKELSEIDEIRKYTTYTSNNKNKKILLPIDLVISRKISKAENVKVVPVDKLPLNSYQLDIGPETIKLFAEKIRQAKYIIWNGPLGNYEIKTFSHGSYALARLIANRSSGKAYGLVGGGETIDVLRNIKMESYIDWISTGGGAMLAYLAGEKMPGLEGII